MLIAKLDSLLTTFFNFPTLNPVTPSHKFGRRIKMAEDYQSYPLVAQIPLHTFQLPDFPEQASRLRSLTLTADIKLDEYQALVQDTPSNDETFNIPGNLPQSITHLTFELFSLGFPAGYLGSIASSLPNLKSLTLFSSLIDGITEGSRKDAEAFFEKTPLLAELHVLDTFARVGFWQKTARLFEQRAKKSKEVRDEGGLKVLEVSYTYRGFEDEGFLARVGGEEWADWILERVVGVAFGLIPERPSEIENDEGDDKEKQIEGILPFAVDSRASESLRKKFSTSTISLRELKMLDLSLWTLRSAEVGAILKSGGSGERGSSGKIADLTVSVLMEDGWWSKLLDAVGAAGDSLEGIEVIGVPSDTKEMRAAVQNGKSEGGSEVALLGKHDLEALAAVCPSLSRLTMTILRARSFGRISWTKIEKGSWEESRA
jgi:hypothetical protein